MPGRQVTDPVVAIIDSGGANISSIVFAFERIGCQPVFTEDWATIQAASHVVLPGVGAAAASMDKLRQSGLAEKIPTLVQPVVGICLGMQLLFQSSQESRNGGNVPCLGIIPAKVTALRPADSLTIPHMGWNRNHFVRGDDASHPVFHDVPEGFYSYFVHSYAAPVGPWTIAKCNHGQWFSSMVSHRNFLGIQFHPERSGAIGAQLLKQFLNLASGANP